MKKIVLLISGRGSNAMAIAKACQDGKLDAQIIGVIADREPCEGLDRAKDFGLLTLTVPYKKFSSRLEFDHELMTQIRMLQPDWVVLAGFMRILTPTFVDAFLGRLINIHPSLLPLFPGLYTHRQALQAGAKVHGATVHFVTPELDHGPAILQKEVNVLPGDDEVLLAARVLAIEHALYIDAIDLLLRGQAKFSGKLL